MKAKFEISLREALKNKNYIQANALIEEEKFSITNKDKLSEKDIKEVILEEIYNASNKHEHSLRFHGGNDNSVLGICKKILAANPTTKLDLGDLYSSTRDEDLGVSVHHKFLK